MPLEKGDLDRALLLSLAALSAAEAGDDVETLGLLVERGTILAELESTEITDDFRSVLLEIQSTDRRIRSALADLQGVLAGELVKIFHEKRGGQGYATAAAPGNLDKVG